MVEKYYKEQLKEYVLYGYAPPPDGRSSADGKDYRTVERYKEYKEAGFNALLAQMTALYCGEKWEISEAKRVMDAALVAGIDKVILIDKTIMELSRVVGGLIGKDKAFESECELDETVARSMQDYRNHEVFYGVQIVDEPSAELFESIGQVYRSIKRVCPSAFVQCNLFPLAPYRMINAKFPQGKDLFERFEKYVEGFLDATGADYFMYDCYPFEPKPSFMPTYIRGLQLSAKIARKRGCKFYFVAQSFSMAFRGSGMHVKPTAVDMRWQINLLLAHGVRQLGYFTYWTKNVKDENGESYPDDSGMLTKDGEKTQTYFDVKAANAKIKTLAPILSDFEFNKTSFTAAGFRSYPCYENFIYGEENPRVKAFKTDKEQALLNEFTGKNTDEYMYVLVNSTPSGYVYTDGDEQHSTITYNDAYDAADVFINEWQTVKLKDNTLSLNLRIGEAAYIIPYKTGGEK